MRYTQIPVLEIRKNGPMSVQYRWKADIKDFKMPVRIKTRINSSEWKMLQVTSNWQTLKAGSIIPDTDNFYINVKILSD